VSRTAGRSGRQGGFTLIELVISLAIIAMLAAVIVPTVIGRLNGSQSAVLISQFAQLRDAAASQRADLGRYPPRLRQLVTAPVAGDKDSCGRTIPVLALPSWAGPYLERTVPTSGLVLGSAVIPDTLRRNPAAFSMTGTLTLVAANVDSLVAVEMERNLDGNADLTTGTITWTNLGNDTVRFNFPVSGC
jgi:prepilin-type N-terminal cleavage/methylation domain-containing protein